MKKLINFVIGMGLFWLCFFLLTYFLSRSVENAIAFATGAILAAIIIFAFGYFLEP